MRLLLESGADTDLAMIDGMTALMWASLNSYPDVVCLLLESGADQDLVDNDGGTALMWASTNGHPEVARVRG